MSANNEYIPIFGTHGRQKSQLQQYTDRRWELMQSCRKTAPNGASYIALGEYYKKLNQA